MSATTATAADLFSRAIIEREQALHDAERRGDVDYFRRQLPNDFVEVGAGGRFSKNDILAGLPDMVIRKLETSNFNVIRLGADAAIVHYQLELDGDYKGQKLPAKFTISSAWVQRGGNWEIVFHQGSKW